MMKQLVLDIRPDAPPTLENFVAGSNAELVATVSLLADPATAAQLPARHIFLWGGAGSGRSHLLRATAAMAREAGRMQRLVDDLMSLSRIEMSAHVRPAEMGGDRLGSHRLLGGEESRLHCPDEVVGRAHALDPAARRDGRPQVGAVPLRRSIGRVIRIDVAITPEAPRRQRRRAERRQRAPRRGTERGDAVVAHRHASVVELPAAV